MGYHLLIKTMKKLKKNPSQVGGQKKTTEENRERKMVFFPYQWNRSRIREDFIVRVKLRKRIRMKWSVNSTTCRFSRKMRAVLLTAFSDTIKKSSFSVPFGSWKIKAGVFQGWPVREREREVGFSAESNSCFILHHSAEKCSVKRGFWIKRFFAHLGFWLCGCTYVDSGVIHLRMDG